MGDEVGGGGMTPRYRLILGDNRQTMKEIPDGSVDCVVTSPPYFGLRSYFPDVVRPKQDCPDWVIVELEKLGVLPIAHTSE